MKAKPGDIIVVTNPNYQHLFGRKCTVLPPRTTLELPNNSEYIRATIIDDLNNEFWLLHTSYKIVKSVDEVHDAKSWEQKMRQKKHDAMAKMLGF